MLRAVQQRPSLVTPIPAKPRKPRGKSHPSLQCHNWPDWVADGAVWSYPVSAKGILAILGVRIELLAVRVVGAM